MKITQRNGSFVSFLYDELGNTVFHVDSHMIYLVGKNNMRELSTWWFYQDKYKNSSEYSYGNIVFVAKYIRVTIK